MDIPKTNAPATADQASAYAQPIRADRAADHGMILPTIGRVVWYWRDLNQGQPYSARVALVHNDRLINIAYDNEVGLPNSVQKVALFQAGDDRPVDNFCEWPARADPAGRMEGRDIYGRPVVKMPEEQQVRDPAAVRAEAENNAARMKAEEDAAAQRAAAQRKTEARNRA